MLYGEYHPNLDDKGRLMVPAKVRAMLNGSNVTLTRGADDCLWLFPSEEWKQIRERLQATISPFQSKGLVVLRRLVAPAQELEIDRTGRIAIPQPLRQAGGLRKECIMLGVGKHMELWDMAAYETYLQQTDGGYYQEAMEATLGEMIL